MSAIQVETLALLVSSQSISLVVRGARLESIQPRYSAVLMISYEVIPDTIAIPINGTISRRLIAMLRVVRSMLCHAQ